MEREVLLFKYRRVNATLPAKKRRNFKETQSLCSKYLSSSNLSLSIMKDNKVNLPQISKTQAKLSYIESYKNLEKIIDKGTHEKSLPSPVTLYLRAVKSKGMVPETMGLLKKNRVQNSIDISHYSMGNSYALALSEGIKNIKLTKAVFKNNRLNDEGASNLISKLQPDFINEINLSQNSIGLNSIITLCRLADIDSSRLNHINLDSNSLGDKPVILLASVLSNSDRIAELSLCDNGITEFGASALAKYVRATQTLERLDLHWNTIRGEGAKEFADSLCENSSIKILDLSWNALTSPQGENSITNFAKAIKQNIKIYHLDLSDNSFNENECKMIGEGLIGNSTLIGLHMDGNGAILDNKGFLQLSVQSSRTRNTHIYSRMMSRKKRNLENCWVCQRWNEVIFTIKPKANHCNFVLNLDIYQYQPEPMEKMNDRSFKLSKICPPGIVKFFFSSNGEVFLNPEYASEAFKPPLVIGEISASSYNYIINKECSKAMWNVFHPRAYPREKVDNSEVEQWDFRHSIFKDYIKDNPKLLEQCYEYDLSLSSISNLLQDSKDHTINILRIYYPAIKEIYKAMASISRNSWKLWQENIIDLFSSTRVMDNIYLKPTDILAILRNLRILDAEPPPELARYQFLELIVRVALIRYFRSNILNQLESVETVGKELEAILPGYSSHEFRVKKYWNYAVDRSLKKHLNWLVSTFASIEKDGLAMFKDVVRVLMVYCRIEDNVLKCCYLARETKRYAKYYENYLRFPEFLEALVRAIDNERIDQDLKKLSIDVLIDIVINDYFKSSKLISLN